MPPPRPPEFVGLCGRDPLENCRLVWNSTYSNRIGSYPSDLLPSQRTTWHATTNSAFGFSAPIFEPGTTFGLPLAGLLIGLGFVPPQSDIFKPKSNYIVIFAQIANRLDVSHIITQEEIDSISSEGLLAGEMRINVGEFILEFVAVTDEEGVVEEVGEEQGGLTEAELDEIGQTGETEQDRVFRKLMTLSYPGNRFINIEKNDLGIEFRFDNGGPKAVQALKTAGIGDINTASYRDGSSKQIIIRSEVGGETLAAGDVVHLSYIAIKEHYLRQSVIVSWTIQAVSVPPQCVAFPSEVRVSSYRFYEWEIPPDRIPLRPVTVSGWRVVETHGINVNETTAVGIVENGELVDYLLSGEEGSQGFIGGLSETVAFLPGGAGPSDIRAFIADRSTMPTYTVPLNARNGPSVVHLNEGVQGNSTAFHGSEWFTRANFLFAKSRFEAKRHVFFNVHPRALFKRDVDKYGIERSVAEEVKKDIDNGKITFFPFMDDIAVDNPTLSGQGANEGLDSSNTKFEPIQPVSGFGVANATTECGVGGAQTLLYSGGPNDIIGQFIFSSNFISERFDLDTKIIVERHFSTGQVGTRFVSLQGVGAPGRALSCIGDPSRGYAFAVHTNEDEKLLINTFKIGPVFDSLRLMSYRPDLAEPPVFQNNDPLPSQFEQRVGYSGMIGDRPGYAPGMVVSTSWFATLSSYTYKTTSAPKLKKAIPDLEDTQITEIDITRSEGKITIPLSNAFHGTTEIVYSYSGVPFETMLLFRTGSVIEGVVDSLLVAKGDHRTLSVDHRWMKGNSIDFVGDNVSLMTIFSITVSQLTEARARDFSDGVDSSTPEDLNRIPDGTLMETRQFFDTDVMSMGEDDKSRVFVFFNDKNGGISCVQSNDFGGKWVFHYGIMEPVGGNEVRHPFIVNSFETSRGFLFFVLEGKICCKVIPYPLFRLRDAFLIERFDQDILDVSGEVPLEKEGVFSEEGKRLRRRIPSHVAAGDLTNAEFLSILGKQISAGGEGTTDPHEFRNVERIETTRLGQTTVTERKKVLKQPIVLGSGTAFANSDVTDLHFSAYITDKGVLRLFFHGHEDGSNLLALQCHFSSDDGTNWYDNWEYIENKFNRLRIDSNSKTQFLDQSADGSPVPDTDQANPFAGSQTYPFGLFIHGYRQSFDEEGLVAGELPVEIESPYVFHQPTAQKVFVFYLLAGALLCKIFPSSILENAGEIAEVKQTIERNIRSQFVDGNLTDPTLLSDLFQYINPDTRIRNERGLFAFPNLLGQEDEETVDPNLGLINFDIGPNISAQRVCASELPNANVRVFYKLDGSNALRAASWNGSFWMVEEFLRDPKNVPDRGVPGSGG